MLEQNIFDRFEINSLSNTRILTDINYKTILMTHKNLWKQFKLLS